MAFPNVGTPGPSNIYATGDVTTAVRAAKALLDFFRTQRSRFQAITEGRADPANPMHRPHIRFDGERLAEVNQRWSHAQNDALGYFLWWYCRLARVEPSLRHPEAWECLRWFPAYLDAIRFWEDPDSGHWEEVRKVSASSIGAVVAGLRQMRLLVQEHAAAKEDRIRLDRLIEHGVAALQRILPCEAREPQALYRRYDAALLFLLYPLEVEELLDRHAATIVTDVTTRLQGEHGIRRYLGDSYWFADYKTKLPAHLRTADLSASTAPRDAYLRPGEEAQWCLFDPILSVIHGRRAMRQLRCQEVEHAEESRGLQVHYLNRALGQLTSGGEHGTELRCPEAYYLCEGRYVPNDHTPLLWTQANLWLALHEMRRALQTGVPARVESG
ncbi:MAG: phosphorylase kinase [Verrucomicrobiales bacterium]|nr:phosphorylase kinase [Verrucomicrobiales bacterium]